MPRTLFWTGFRQSMPFLLVLIPFSMVFGVVATEAGLNVAEVLAFSVIVIAGAAQFTALHLLQDNAPTLIVLASSVAVNLRMAMYSAAMTPYLGAAPLWKRALVAYALVDQSYAVSALEFEQNKAWGLSHRLWFFFGLVVPVCLSWYAGTLAGALVGNAIPPEFALDFAVPITFLALIGPALRTLPHIAAAATALVLSPLLMGVPHSLGVLIAGICAMIVGAGLEKHLARGAA